MQTKKTAPKLAAKNTSKKAVVATEQTAKEKRTTNVINQSFELPNVSTAIGKEVSIKVSQSDDMGCVNSFTQKMNVTNDTLSILIGTAMNRLFEYQDALNSIGDKGKFKSTLPLVIQIESENQLIDTNDLSEVSRNGLRIGNTAKRKRALARKMYVLTSFIISGVREISYEALEAELLELE